MALVFVLAPEERKTHITFGVGFHVGQQFVEVNRRLVEVVVKGFVVHQQAYAAFTFVDFGKNAIGLGQGVLGIGQGAF